MSSSQGALRIFKVLGGGQCFVRFIQEFVDDPYPAYGKSPHAERLLADCHRHLARVEQYDSDCYIQEDDRAKLPRDQSEEIDREQAMEDDRPPRDDQDTMLESSRLGHYRTRRVTRMESYTLEALGDLRAETHTLCSSGTSST